MEATCIKKDQGRIYDVDEKDRRGGREKALVMGIFGTSATSLGVGNRRQNIG
jgi:hypothetical protein